MPCEVASDIRSERVFIKRGITAPNTRKHTGNATKILGKQFWNNWRVTNQEGWLPGGLQPGGATGQLPPLNRICTEDVLHVRNLRKCFLNYEAIERQHKKYNDWWNLHACLRLLTTKIEVDIDFITKTKKQKLFCYFVGVLCIFFLAENLYFEWQTNKQKT